MIILIFFGKWEMTLRRDRFKRDKFHIEKNQYSIRFQNHDEKRILKSH